MAQYDGSIRINTQINTNGVNQGVAAIGRSLTAVKRSVAQTNASLSALTDTVKRLGYTVAAAFSVRVLSRFEKEALDAASDLEAMEAQFSQVFGELEDTASKSLSNIAEQAGITEERMKGSYTKIAAFAKTTGMDTADALGLADRAMVAVADSAAFYDRSLEETTESLQSFLKGNYENDAVLGLSATEYTRNAAAMKLYGKSFNELSEAQKQLTLLQILKVAEETDWQAFGRGIGEFLSNIEWDRIFQDVFDIITEVVGGLVKGFGDTTAGKFVLAFAAVKLAIKGVKLVGTIQGVLDKLKILGDKVTGVGRLAANSSVDWATLTKAMGLATAAMVGFKVGMKLTEVTTSTNQDLAETGTYLS